MAEGLDPIEAGRKLHEHGKGESEPGGGGKEGGEDESDSRHSRIVQICEALLLALVTVAAAWAGYSAARWSTESRVDVARSSTLRNLATREDLTALELRNFDSATFNAWYTAFTLNRPAKETVAERLAAVLFLVGIGTSFKMHGLRYALIGFGSVLLILSVVLILQQPGLPPG